MSFKDKTILITGAAGFIGSHLTQTLLDAGARIIAIDDFNDFYDPGIKRQNIAPFLASPEQFTLVEGDIRDAALIDQTIGQAAKELDQIVHLAARAGVRPSLTQAPLYLETNVTATLNILESMKKHKVGKIVFASSSSVYGNRTDPPFREDQDISKPVSPYAATKAMGEALLHSYSHLFGINATALRFFTVYGPSQRPDLAIHSFARKIDQGIPIPVFGDGSTERDYTYIDDIIHGVLGAMRYTQTPYEVFNLGESHPIKLSTLISLLEDALGKAAVIDRQPMQPGDVVMTCADISKARQLLGYNPQTLPETGIPKFVSWLRGYYDSMSPNTANVGQ